MLVRGLPAVCWAGVSLLLVRCKLLESWVVLNGCDGKLGSYLGVTTAYRRSSSYSSWKFEREGTMSKRPLNCQKWQKISHIPDFCDGGYDNSPEAQRKLSCLCLNLLVKLDYFAPLHLMTSEIQNTNSS